MSNVGIGFGIGILDGNTGLKYVGGNPFNFLSEATPPYPPPPNSEMGPPSEVALSFAQTITVDYYERTRLRLVQKEDLSKEIAIIAKVGPAGTVKVHITTAGENLCGVKS